MKDILSSTRTRLTALRDEDAASLAGWFSDSEFLRMYDGAMARPLGEAEMRKKIEAWRDSRDEIMFAQRAGDGEVLIGFGGLDGINWRNGAGWLALAIAPDLWGRGYGGELLAMILGYAFDELDLHRVQLTVFDYNERAIALYRSQGLQQEGVFREAIYRDGSRHDMLLMSILQREWRSAQG